MKVLFVAGFGPIIRDVEANRTLFVKDMGLPLVEEEGHYFHTEEVDGVKHFALWPLSQASVSCFGSEVWPSDTPVPTAWMEFEVEDIEAASAELADKGYLLITRAQKEPWGQVVTRLLSPDGVLTGLAYTPSMRSEP